MELLGSEWLCRTLFEIISKNIGESFRQDSDIRFYNTTKTTYSLADALYLSICLNNETLLPLPRQTNLINGKRNLHKVTGRYRAN